MDATFILHVTTFRKLHVNFDPQITQIRTTVRAPVHEK